MANEKQAKEKKAKPPKPAKKKPPKGMRGKMPVKRSINLIVVNENKINPFAAVLGILLILVAAAAFSKFLVYDRIMEVSTASGAVAQARKNLESAQELLSTFGDVEDTYAHYTQDGMTSEELSLVDRTSVLALVRTLLSEGNATFGPPDFRERFDDSIAVSDIGADDFDPWALRSRLREFVSSRRDDTTVYTWSVTGNTLTVQITGGSLQKLNKVARRLETSPIVDSVTISTANKQGNVLDAQNVSAQLIIYLMQPVEEASAS